MAGQIIQTNSYEELGIDCVVEGRSESTDTLDLFAKAIRGEELPKQVDVVHPKDRDAFLFPRQAHDVWRRRNDDGLWAALPVLRAGFEPAN